MPRNHCSYFKNVSLKKRSSCSSILFLILTQIHVLRNRVNWLLINKNISKVTFLEQILIEVATMLYKLWISNCSVIILPVSVKKLLAKRLLRLGKCNLIFVTKEDICFEDWAPNEKDRALVISTLGHGVLSHMPKFLRIILENKFL